MIAAKRGHLMVVRALLEAGADPNIALYKVSYRALHSAAQEGHDAIVIELINHGADVNATTQFGETALISAAYRGKTSTVRILLSHGADPLLASKNGITASSWATRRGYPETASLLLSHQTSTLGTVDSKHESIQRTWVYESPKGGYKITLPLAWKVSTKTHRPIDAGFTRIGSPGWLTISTGPIGGPEAPYSVDERKHDLNKLCWMEKESEVTTQPVGELTNVVRGKWALESGRDDGPVGTPRWGIPSERGLTSVVVGATEQAIEWVLQYRVELGHSKEISQIISSFQLLDGN